MARETKKKLSTTLLLPVFTLTSMQIPNAWAQTQQSPTFIERIFAGNKNQQRNVTLNAAATNSPLDERVIQLEQAVHDLTSQVENLNIQILQMRNHIDVLEGKTPSNAAIAQSQQISATQSQLPTNGQVTKTQNVQTNSTSINNSIGTPSLATSNSNSDMQNLGAVHFDRDGNIIANDNKQNTSTNIPAGGNQTVSIPQTSTAKDLYQLGYQSILTGDYRAAEPIFRTFQERYPNDPLTADASFWLGESLYGQGRYREAAQAYIDVDRNYHTAPRAPENMLKLGMTMAKLDDNQTACAIFAQIPQKYKQAEPAVLKRVNDEQKSLNCSQ